MTKELVDTGSSITGSDTHHQIFSPTHIAHSNLDDLYNNNDDLTSANTTLYTIQRSIDQVQGQADEVAARLRKAEMCAAAAAMISAAAKASKRRQRNIHTENTAALGRDLIHRVDTQTILTSVDHIIAPSSSTRVTSIDDDHAKAHQPSSYPSTPTSSEPTASDYDLFDNNVDEIDTTSPPPELEPNNNKHRNPSSEEKTVSLALRIPFKRKAAVQELIATEQSYCKDLDQLVHYFFATVQKADCISESKKHDLVRNASEVLQFQRGFATALEAASETPVAEHGSVDRRVITICECFCEWADQFSVYIPYCIYHDRATDVLNHLQATNHRFITLLDKMHAHTRAHDDRRTFQDYLIMPVQRLLKYKLILETIAKTIQPYDEEYDIMNRSLQVMHHVASRINSEKSSLETKRKTTLFNDRVDWHSIVGASDQFVKELGDCAVIGTLDVRILHVKVDKVKRLGCALYPTYMVICTTKRQNKYTPQHWFPMSLLELEDIPDEHPNANYAWLLRSDNRVFQFFAMSEQEKKLWIDALQNAIQKSRELYDESATTTAFTAPITDRPMTPSSTQPSLTELSLHNLPTQSSAPSSPVQSINKFIFTSTCTSRNNTTSKSYLNGITYENMLHHARDITRCIQ
ncbi:Dbl homology domain-containing protein [Lichtheimia hyalospora FSU 10163]|nr:Dbl homology domain-containing protein [Lichtheimia hyalospora FSU 10163]